MQDVTSIYTYLPWIPKWIDLNVVVPTTATIVVIIVGIIVVCFAWSRRVHENGQTRLRGTYYEQLTSRVYYVLLCILLCVCVNVIKYPIEI